MKARPKCAAELEAETSLLRLQRLAARDLEAQRAELNHRPAAFVTTSQTLSLHFGSALPTSVVRGRQYSVRLCVSNEFGLWTRSSNSHDASVTGPGVQCQLLALERRGAGSGAPSLRKSPRNLLGEDGRADCTFSIEENASDTDYWVLLKFSLDSRLPCGRDVAPIVSLPLFVPATPSPSAVACNGDVSSRLQEVVAMCRDLSGQSIKIFDPLPSPEEPSLESCRHIYALECPGSLGIGGQVALWYWYS